MLSGRIRRRALALLGALLLVILVWSPCCASMPKPPPAVLPMAPWEMVPPSRPHPAAALLPVELAYPHGGVDTGSGSHGAALKRHGPVRGEGERSPQETGERQQQQRQQEPPESGDGSRKSRREGDLSRLMRVLKQSVEPNERRTRPEVSEARRAAQLSLSVRENNPPRPHHYSIESTIDENKSHPTRTVPQAAYRPAERLGGRDKAADRVRAEFDDTPEAAAAAAARAAVASSQPSSPAALSRSRRSSSGTPAAGNPHRHQHKLPPSEQQLDGAVWHGRRGGGGGRQQPQPVRNNDPNLERNERSANLSHISGATRKIQLFIKNRYVQLLPDGTVNGTHDDLGDYTILQRTTVGIGQIKIQAVATCLFLCMDTCGSVYGSKEFSDDCIFNEQMEQHHYNTYSSTQHSNSRRTLYLALNKTGQPRKIQIPVNRTLGKLATYTKALTQTVAHDRVEQLVSRLFGADHVRHGLSQLCETGQPLVELTAKEMRPRPACGSGGGQAKGLLAAGNGKKHPPQQHPPGAGASKDEGKEGPRQKKKKKRRKCREDELPGEHCFRPGQGGAGGTNSGKKRAGQQHPGQPRAGSGSISSGSTSSTSSVGSSSAGGTNQSAASLAGNVSSNSSSSSSNSSISNSGTNSSANSLIASISSGGPHRQGLPYAQLTATPNTRKPKPTRKLTAGGGGGMRTGSQQAAGGGGQSPGGQARKPKKPTQQPHPHPSGPASGGKRTNGTSGNANKPGPARSKLVAAGLVPPKAHPKPASLMIDRPLRPTTPNPVAELSLGTTTTTTSTTTTAKAMSTETFSTSATNSEPTPSTTVSNALEDTSQQSEDAELDMDDVLQASAEIADDLDELDEGSPTASSWHELLPARSVSEQRGRYKASSCCSFLSLSSLVVYGATVHLLYL